MRTLVLTREFLELPERMAELRSETEQWFARLTERVDQLTVRVEHLAEFLKELGFQVKRNGDAIGQLKGDLLELRLRERAPTWLASIVRRPRVLSADELDDLLEAAVGEGRLSDEEAGRLRLLDAIVRGRRDGEQVLLAVEASHGVGPHDVERAAEGARVLRKTGGRGGARRGGALGDSRGTRAGRQTGRRVRAGSDCCQARGGVAARARGTVTRSCMHYSSVH